MAKHKKHKKHGGRGGFKAFGLAFPGIKDIKKSASGTSILMGAAIGAAGVIGIRYAFNKLTAVKDSAGNTKEPMIKAIPEIVSKLAPLLGGVLLGGLAFALYRKKSASKAAGWLIGAVGAGAAATGLEYLSTTKWVKENTTYAIDAKPAAGYGLLQRDRNYGLLQRDNMARLSAMAMGNGAEEIEELLS